jgi:hypothetical protein
MEEAGSGHGFPVKHTSWIPCEVCLGLATLEFNVHADTADM